MFEALAVQFIVIWIYEVLPVVRLVPPHCMYDDKRKTVRLIWLLILSLFSGSRHAVITVYLSTETDGSFTEIVSLNPELSLSLLFQIEFFLISLVQLISFHIGRHQATSNFTLFILQRVNFRLMVITLSFCQFYDHTSYSHHLLLC